MKKLILILFVSQTLTFFSQEKYNDKFVIGGDSVNLPMISKIIEIEINKIRFENGLDTLMSDDDLRNGALSNSKKSSTMSEKPLPFHTDKEAYEVSVSSLIGTHGNEASTSQIVKLLIYSWMNSPPHKKAILNETMTKIGCGSYIDFRNYDYELVRFGKNNQNIKKKVKGKRYYIWSSVRFNK